ncbi:site-specific integrase [Nocardioides jejuensis]|uniref:Site-specific integrase n=1 Tax=Nocardioides jejuensis TaxID=2502782 RepID=A0A4V2NXK9_9ACTN|nr:site-specific integrase [Nocardioides jejuensis]TCJ21642.1 site-specific integrase [Nocardioides jejuensis]
MDLDVLLEYRDDVRFEHSGIAPSTWNGDVAALQLFHDSAVGAGIIKSPLMTARDWQRLRVADRSVRWPRVVEAEDYGRFRAVGLQGLDGHGRMTEAGLAMRTPVRDALYADFLVSHGCRRAEASHLTLLDLPARVPSRAFNTGFLPPEICKWGSGRELEESAAWASRLAVYQETEWFLTVEIAQSALRRLSSAGDLVVVTDVARRGQRDCGVLVKGLGWRRLATLSKRQRTRLVATPDIIRRLGAEPGAGRTLSMVRDDWLIPLAAFPGTRTPMVGPEAWSMTFREANARVAACQGRESRRVTPHMLRHTFAVNTLSDLLRQVADADRAYLLNLDEARRTDTAMLRRRYQNPLLRVQRLLGHKNLETTLLYLQYLVQESQAAIPQGDSWIEHFLGEGGE